MDAREQALNLLNRIWAKLQNLPNANPIDLGAFVILLTFMRESRMSSATNHGYSSRIDHDTVCFLSGSGVPAHVGADLCNVLLLSQDQDERVKHLSKCASHSGNYSRMNQVSCRNTGMKAFSAGLPGTMNPAGWIKTRAEIHGHVLIDRRSLKAHTRCVQQHRGPTLTQQRSCQAQRRMSWPAAKHTCWICRAFMSSYIPKSACQRSTGQQLWPGEKAGPAAFNNAAKYMWCKRLNM